MLVFLAFLHQQFTNGQLPIKNDQKLCFAAMSFMRLVRQIEAIESEYVCIEENLLG